MYIILCKCQDILYNVTLVSKLFQSIFLQLKITSFRNVLYCWMYNSAHILKTTYMYVSMYSKYVYTLCKVFYK